MPVLKLDNEIAARVGDTDVAGGSGLSRPDDCSRGTPGSASQGLTCAALPDSKLYVPCSDFFRVHDADALGEEWICLNKRADSKELFVLRKLIHEGDEVGAPGADSGASNSADHLVNELAVGCDRDGFGTEAGRWERHRDGSVGAYCGWDSSPSVQRFEPLTYPTLPDSVKTGASQAVTAKILRPIGIEHPQINTVRGGIKNEQTVGTDSKATLAKVGRKLRKVETVKVLPMQQHEIVTDRFGFPKVERRQTRCSSR